MKLIKTKLVLPLQTKIYTKGIHNNFAIGDNVGAFTSYQTHTNLRRPNPLPLVIFVLLDDCFLLLWMII